MSISDAIVQATESVLSTYLAPDLVARLSEEIMAQAMPDIQESLGACIGVDLSKPAKAAAAKPAKAAKAKPAKAKKAEQIVNKDGDGNDEIDVPMHAAQDDAREMLPA